MIHNIGLKKQKIKKKTILKVKDHKKIVNNLSKIKKIDVIDLLKY
jgi:hypothetical protein